MKHWQETGEILARLGRLSEAGEPAALACVVDISGSTYRRPGARFLIEGAGTTLGGVSGGCLEEDVRQNGLRVIDDGACRFLHYETGNDDDTIWGLGLGCDGAVDVFVQPATHCGLAAAHSGSAAAHGGFAAAHGGFAAAHGGFAAAAGAFRDLLAGDQSFAVVTLLGAVAGTVAGAVAGTGDEAGGEETTDADNLTGRVLVVHAGAIETGTTGDGAKDAELLAAATDCLAEGGSKVVSTTSGRAFVETLRPPASLFVCGAGDDAMPLVRAAAGVGFRVVVVDHRPGYLNVDRFPGARQLVRANPEDGIGDMPIGNDSFVVLKTHNLVRDKAWAQRFLASPVSYIGLLGPRARCDEIAESVSAADRGRLYGPVGLDLGAEGPEQVGLAIVSELLAVRARRHPGHLRAREVPIHA